MITARIRRVESLAIRDKGVASSEDGPWLSDSERSHTGSDSLQNEQFISDDDPKALEEWSPDDIAGLYS